MITHLVQLMAVIDSYESYATMHGIPLNKDGFPILGRSQYLDTWPQTIVDYDHRNSHLVQDPKHTVICLFRDDLSIYRRLEKTFDDIPEYKRFMGVIASDVTVTRDMDIEWQAEIMLLNQLFMATLAVNDIKVVMNLRSGSPETLGCFSTIPPGASWASSTLGCDSLKSDSDLDYISKVMRVRPGKLMLYGKEDTIAEKQLSRMGVGYRCYPDIHRALKCRSYSTTLHHYHA